MWEHYLEIRTTGAKGERGKKGRSRKPKFTEISMSAAVSKSFEEIVAEDVHLKRLRKMHRRAVDWASRLRHCIKVTGRGGLAVGEGSQEDTERRVEGEVEGLAGRVARNVELIEKKIARGQAEKDGFAERNRRRIGGGKGAGRQEGMRGPKRDKDRNEDQ
jgi:hypothetical protein